MITDAWLKSNNGKARDKIHVYSDRDGLGVRATLKGRLVFQYRYRFNGKQLRVDIGPYPAIGLKRAREKHAELKTVLAEGRDPKSHSLRQKMLTSNENSLQELYQDYHNKYASHHKKSAGDSLGSMKVHIFPKYGALPAADIEIYQWIEILEKISEKTPSISERILTSARQMYAWGIRMQRVKRNPLSDLSAKRDLRIKRQRRVKSLEDETIRLIWWGIEESNLRHKNSALVRLLLMWGCRIGELRVAKKADFDLHKNIWTVPAENHKTGRITGKPLKRPILPEMAALIKGLIMSTPDHYEYAFANVGDDAPVGDRSHLSIPINLNAYIKKHLSIDVEYWSVHDLRSSARSRWSEFAPPHICEIALGHALPAMWQTYDHYEYLEEQRELYVKWIEKLKEIVA